jgi:ATP-dependent DNA helicase RecG
MSEQLDIFGIGQNPEDQNVEYKTASQGRVPADIWEAYTGFANAEGGTIYFGIEDNGKNRQLTPSEIDTIQRDMVTGVSGYSYKLSLDINHKNGVVSVYVPPAPAAVRPVYSLKRGAKNGARVRVGSANLQVDEEWMKKFAIAGKGGAEGMVFDVEYKDVLDMDAVEEFITRINKRRGNVYKTYTVEEICVKLNILDKSHHVTLFGLLAFSKGAELQDIVSPTLTTVVTQYPGTSKVGDKGTETFIDNREFYGPVRKQFEESLVFILSKIPVRGKILGTGLRTDQPTIPEIAVREALANTYAHRDYSVQSSRVQIEVYSDRIEFINPGRSLVPIEDLDVTPSVTRNPFLMNYLREIGATEQLARGIRTIKHELRTAGLQEPKFANIGASFVATMYHSAFIQQVEKQWLGKFHGMKLNERQRTALLNMKNMNTGIDNKQYRAANGMNRIGDDKTANKDLRRLVDFGILVKIGEYKLTKYYIDDKYLN